MTIINALTAVFYALVLGLYSWKLLLLLLGLSIPIQLLVMGLLIPMLRKTNRELQVAGGELNSAAYEHFNGVDTLRALHAQTAARWRFETKLGQMLDKRKRLEQLGAVTAGVAEGFSGLLHAGGLLLAVILFLEGELSLGQVVAVSSLVGSIVGPLVAIIAEWGTLAQTGVSLSRIDDFITSAPEREAEGVSDHEQQQVKGHIAFENVSFQYGSELSPLVLRGISLEIQPGETVAFVGPSGSGKSTLAYMVNRLYEPVEGRVLLDGVPVAELPLRTLRSQVAMVLQENQLFSGTLLDNITLGDPKPDFDRAVQAAKAADAHEFILRQPKGYSTPIFEGGSNISGGQRQRINIARALYRTPRVLILDEATAALHSATEQVIVRNIKAMAGNITTLIVAHRLNTIMYADRIVVVSDGEVLEMGTHKELLDNGGWYAQMVRRQSM